ncbi:MAG: Signal transduction histidine-protein kinase BaeS [Pelotomaculum sp. PtaB.Bin104]|nr:MAG: Signal transduction histidine-protein kinase BaeS [Pelotomaculum sp. PtaB.Bin104]
MKAFSNSILLKLWFFTVTLVLIVIYITGVVQTRQLKELFYNQQLSEMTGEAKNIALTLEMTELSPLSLLPIAETLNANIMLTDMDGYIIHCLGMGMNMVDVGKEKISVTAHHDIPLKNSDIQAVLQGSTIYYRGPYFLLDTEVITVVAPTYNQNRITGMVMLSAPLAHIEERVAALQKVTIYAGLAGIVVATLLCLLFSRSITRPLLYMNQAAQDMAGGNYSRQVKVNSRDEIGMLANSLNTLAADLHAKLTTLERLDKTRRDFVINVAHELRTPLSIIQGFSEALLDGMAGSESDRHKYLENKQTGIGPSRSAKN